MHQLTHVLIVWGVTVSILLLAAFVDKVSDNYSRGWALATIFGATGFLFAGPLRASRPSTLLSASGLWCGASRSLELAKRANV